MSATADQPTTLAEVFGLDGRSSTRRLGSADRDRLGAAIRGKPQLGIGDVEQELGGAFSRVLDIKLADVFAGGWSKLHEIAKYADTGRYPRGERHAVPLGRHRISSRHDPVIEVVVEDVTTLRLQLEVSLEAQFEGVVLSIDGGLIRAMRSGAWSASGAVLCGGTQLASVKSRRYDFPGEVRFDPAVAIPGGPGNRRAEQTPAATFAGGAVRDRQPERGSGRGWALSSFDEDGRAIRFSLTPGQDGAKREWSLGRVPERADCVIRHRSVSSEHARIRYRPGHGLEIRDLGSSNGTKVDARPVGSEYVSLEGAGKIMLGRLEMTLSRE